MGKDDFWALALGFLGLLVLSELAKPPCPCCKRKITKGIQVCPHCGSYLSWGDNSGRI